MPTYFKGPLFPQKSKHSTESSTPFPVARGVINENDFAMRGVAGRPTRDDVEKRRKSREEAKKPKPQH